MNREILGLIGEILQGAGSAIKSFSTSEEFNTLEGLLEDNKIRKNSKEKNRDNDVKLNLPY